MSIDYDLFVIDAENEETTPRQLRDCMKDALENIDKRLAKQEKLMEVMISHLDTQSKINMQLARKIGAIPSIACHSNKEDDSVKG